MLTVKLACEAMATRFELVLHGEHEVHLRAAGEEALAEIKRLEAQLSFYRPSSDVSRINAQAGSGSVQVEPRLFHLLQTAQRIYRESEGAFDITVAPLMKCWGFVNGTGSLPAPEALIAARSITGMHLVNLDERAYTVSFSRPGVMVDLGSIGKGYAIEEAALLLKDAGVISAFLHGGTSTIYALGKPSGAEHWNVAIDHPDGNSDTPLAVVPLEDEALSVSAVWGKSFTVDGKVYGHVLDPRSGRPVEGAVLTALVLPSATETDAWSTALLVLGRSGLDLAQRKGLPTLSLLHTDTQDGFEVVQNLNAVTTIEESCLEQA